MYERTYHKTVLKTDEKSSKKGGRQIRLNWKLIAWIVGGAIVITGMVLLIRLPKVQVSTIEVSGVNVVDPGDVSEFVKNTLQGNRLGVLPRTSIFLISTHRLENEIKNAFPRLQTVTVSRKSFSSIAVNATEYQGMYLWCVDSATCYFMDQNGMVFASAPYFSGNAYPKIFTGALQPLPFQAVTPAQISGITLILDHLNSLGIVPSEFHYVTNHELDIYFIHNSQQTTLGFDPSMDIRDQLTALFTGLRTEPLASEFHDQTKVLQYIDLRFLDRVVYKFQ